MSSVLGFVSSFFSQSSSSNSAKHEGHTIRRDELLFEDKISSGAFGIVYKARYNNIYTVAVKFPIAEKADSIAKEIEVMRSLSFPTFPLPPSFLRFFLKESFT